MHYAKLFFVILPIFLLHPEQSNGCFSRGNSGNPSDGNPEAQGLKSENDVRVDHLKEPKPAELGGGVQGEEDDEKSTAAQKVPSAPNLDFDPDFVKAYLKEFGHMKHADDGPVQGVKHFQEFLGIQQTGTVNLPTLQKMSWKRCANTDDGYTGTPEIWERSTLFWNLNSTAPQQFTRQEMKELIAQAFHAWEIVIKIDFLETGNADHAQIIFSFDSDRSKKAAKNDEDEKTGLAVAKASSPPKAHISLNADEKWSTFQTQEEGKLDIFLVLLHEIGHALGLRHSGDENSVMFPMFERPVGEHLPVISNDDVERLRALYVLFAKKTNSVGVRMRVKRDSALISDVAAGDEDNSVVLCCVCPAPLTLGELKKKKAELTGRPTLAADLSPTRAHGAPPAGTNPYSDAEGATNVPEKCPHTIATAANVNSETLFVFKDGYTWHLSRGKLVGGPYKINEFFPDGPEKVDVAFSSGRLTVLVKSRMLFGYEFDQKTAQFTRDRRYPRELHSRIIFYPEGAFPIVNGSIILFKDDVFATYNVESNTPHLFGSVSEFFPGLPQNLRSGFSASPDFATYHMLTKEYAFFYDARVTRSLSSQSIGQFLGCDAAGAGANNNKMPGQPVAQLFYPQQSGPSPQNPRFSQPHLGK
uniref:Matrix metalloproteinase n=1 Tax=Globodera rostochiensis TaxID=31243 RepID=A0A914GWW3_GLORO